MLWIGGLLLLLGARAQLHVCESSLDNSTGAVLESKYVMKALPNTHCRPEGMDDVTYLRLRKSDVVIAYNANECLKQCEENPKCKTVYALFTSIGVNCMIYNTKKIDERRDEGAGCSECHSTWPESCYRRVLASEKPLYNYPESIEMARGSPIYEGPALSAQTTVASEDDTCETTYSFDATSLSWLADGSWEEQDFTLDGGVVVGDACKPSDWETCAYCEPQRSGTDAQGKFILHSPSTNGDGSMACPVETMLENCAKMGCVAVLFPDYNAVLGRSNSRDFRAFPAAYTAQAPLRFITVEKSMLALSGARARGKHYNITISTGSLKNQWTSAFAGGGHVGVQQGLISLLSACAVGLAVWRAAMWIKDSKKYDYGVPPLLLAALGALVLTSAVRLIIFAACPTYSCEANITTHSWMILLPGAIRTPSTVLVTLYFADIASYNHIICLRVILVCACIVQWLFDIIYAFNVFGFEVVPGFLAIVGEVGGNALFAICTAMVYNFVHREQGRTRTKTKSKRILDKEKLLLTMCRQQAGVACLSLVSLLFKGLAVVGATSETPDSVIAMYIIYSLCIVGDAALQALSLSHKVHHVHYESGWDDEDDDDGVPSADQKAKVRGSRAIVVHAKE